MYSHTLRQRIATGTLTLPLTAVLTVLTWGLVAHPSDAGLWEGLAITGLCAYMLMELNNRNTLLRIRSRMVSSCFLVVMAVCPTLHSFSLSLLPMVCFALSYFMLFASYQEPQAQGYLFHAFLFASLGSLLFPPMLVCCLLYYFSMLFQLRNFTWRTFMAGLLGLLTPYWVCAAYAIWHNHLDTAFLYLLDWLTPPLPDYSLLTLPQWITGGTLIVLAVASLIHFAHTAYNDKIRTRMFFYCIATQQVALIAALALMPQCFNQLLPLFVINTAPLLAHHLTLARGWWAELWFYVVVVAAGGMAFANYALA